jgi:hypothetical protein
MRGPRKDRAGVGAGLIAIVIIVAIVAVAGGYYYYYEMASPESVYNLQEGDFVEYTHSQNTYRIEVISVGGETMTVNYTVNIGGYVYSQVQELPLDQTLMLDYSFSDPPPGYTVSFIGKENVDTVWGQRTADHYRASYEQGGSSMLLDIWMSRGVPLMMQTTYEGHPQDFTTLTDTNISFITS